MSVLTLDAHICTLIERIGLEPEVTIISGGIRDVGPAREFEATIGCKVLVLEEP